VDAVVLELHRRRQVQLLDEPAAAGVVPRVVLFGPDAEQRRRSLVSLLGSELQSLDLDALDVRLDQVVELDIETARHLERSGPVRQVFVLAPGDLAGGGIAITLARHLGPDSTVVLVTESGSTPFGAEIEEQSRESAMLADVRLHRVPQHAYDLPVLQAERVADRLGRALYDLDHPTAMPGAWTGLSADERVSYISRARDRIAAAGAVPLRRSALVAPTPAEIPLLEALGFDRPTALARAGLRVDFQSVASLVPAAQRLLASGHEAAFAAWCEVARLQTKTGVLARDTPAPSAGPDAGDVRDLLLLRRAQLGDPGAAGEVRRERTAGRPGGRDTVVLLGGPGEDVGAALALLAPTLRDLPTGIDVWAVAPAGPLRDQLLRLGARADAAGSTRRQALRIWPAPPGDTGGRVRVVALPATAAEDVLLARALGASVGRVEAPGAADLSRSLLNGAAGVVPLPLDRMTVRAFLRPGTWPRALAELREPLAAELHRRYVVRQRTRKPPGDPALLPWPALSPWLQRSNLALVDDIPAKLAAVGLRLDESGAAASVPELGRILADQIELLAELEHGRYTAERLAAGWTNGVRNPARFLSPHLHPWTELDEETKEYDREVVRDLPAVLAAYGVGVCPLES
jgi:hypothetical protein